MNVLLYEELADFYHLLDPLEEHCDEGEELGSVLIAAVPEAQTLLELGSGAGHGAYYLKNKFSHVTLCDLSSKMLRRSETLNPECEHVEGDMRQLRLAKLFDCVLIHDAIAYMTSHDDLARVANTAFAHLRIGGAALVVPDCVSESFCDYCEDHAADEDDRSLRCIAWSHDPNPDDTTHLTDFAFLLREKGEVRAVHDRHTFGLFATTDWVRLWTEAGFKVETISRPLPQEYEGSAYTDKMFLCRKS